MHWQPFPLTLDLNAFLIKRCQFLFYENKNHDENYALFTQSIRLISYRNKLLSYITLFLYILIKVLAKNHSPWKKYAMIETVSKIKNNSVFILSILTDPIVFCKLSLCWLHRLCAVIVIHTYIILNI